MKTITLSLSQIITAIILIAAGAVSALFVTRLNTPSSLAQTVTFSPTVNQTNPTNSANQDSPSPSATPVTLATHHLKTRKITANDDSSDINTSGDDNTDSIVASALSPHSPLPIVTAVGSSAPLAPPTSTQISTPAIVALAGQTGQATATPALTGQMPISSVALAPATAQSPALATAATAGQVAGTAAATEVTLPTPAAQLPTNTYSNQNGMPVVHKTRKHKQAKTPAPAPVTTGCPCSEQNPPSSQGGPPTSLTTIFISAVMTGSAKNSANQYVELANSNNAPFDLSGFSLQKISVKGRASVLIDTARLKGKVVPAHAHFLIVDGRGYKLSASPDLTWASSKKLAKKNNVVMLVNSQGQAISTISWNKIPVGKSCVRQSANATCAISDPTPRNSSS